MEHTGWDPHPGRRVRGQSPSGGQHWLVLNNNNCNNNSYYYYFYSLNEGEAVSQHQLTKLEGRRCDSTPRTDSLVTRPGPSSPSTASVTCPSKAWRAQGHAQRSQAPPCDATCFLSHWTPSCQAPAALFSGFMSTQDHRP